MMYAHRQWQNNLFAGILIGGAAVLGGCLTPAKLPETPTRTQPQRTNRIPYDNIAALTTDALIERHRSELEALVDLTKADDIERGGVIIDVGGATELVEIHNSIRDGPELISRYALGAHGLHRQIQRYLSTSIQGRRISNPDSSPYYNLREIQFTNALANIPILPQKERTSELSNVRIIYAELALHCTYLRDEEEYERLKRRGKILFHVHTHHDGVTRDTPPDEDPLRPSGQDLDISKTQEGVITGVDATGRRMLYYTHKGTYRVLRAEASVAMR